MSHLRTPAESPLYASHAARLGYVPNYARVFALAPEAYAAWQALNAAIRAGMDERRYELVTLAAARALGSRYCALAHARVLRDRFYDDRTLHAIATDRHHAGLDAGDVAAMDFADRIAVDPGAAREADVEALRRHGLSEVDIFQVVLAVAARWFVVWLVLLGYGLRLLRRRPAAVPLVPLAAAVIWLTVVSAGDAWLGWTA